MWSYKKTVTLGLLFLSSFSLFGEHGVEMADVFRKEGKIYVVVAIIVMILTGLILYLISLERRITRFEKKMKNDRKQ